MKPLNKSSIILGLMVLLFQWNIGCSEAQQYEEKENYTLDIAAIEQATGMQGTEQDGEYKLTVPQNDLNVTIGDFSIIPPMGMGSWAAFSPTEAGAILMGDVVVTENEIAAVQQTLIEHGLKVTALHNHFVREQPSVMYMHIGGQGTEKELATGVKAVFDKIAELRGGNPADAEAGEVENSLDTDRIAEILGHEGSASRGVYKVTIGRPDVELKMEPGGHHEEGEEHSEEYKEKKEEEGHDEGEQHHEETHKEDGHPHVSTFMGFNTWAAWQGTPEKAAVAGDFVMRADEVDGVIEALVNNGIEVVALHNHMIHEEPRVFFLHYWGTGSAYGLATGLRKALDQTGVQK